MTKEDPLRVRDYPATGTILGHVPRGAAVEVLEESDSGWLKIRRNELEGWASVLFLEKIVEEAEDGLPATVAIPRELAQQVYEAFGKALDD